MPEIVTVSERKSREAARRCAAALNVMLFAWPILGERPTSRSVIALVLAFAGLAVLFSGQNFSFDQAKIIGVALALGAAVLFAFGSVTAGTPIPLKPIALVAWLVGLGCLPMIVLGLVIEHPDVGALSPRGWALMVYMASTSPHTATNSFFRSCILPVGRPRSPSMTSPVLSYRQR